MPPPGQKYYFRKLLACRSDYCTHCKKPTFTERYRYLVVLTKLTIPILPIGFDSSWFCKECGLPPREVAPYNKLGLAFGILVGLLLSFAVFQLPFPDGEIGAKIVVRGSPTALTLILLFKFLFQNRKAYLANLAGVSPLDKSKCPYCSGALFSRERTRCERCKVDIL